MTGDVVVGDRGDHVEVVVTGRWSPEGAAAFETGGARRLVLNYALGFNEPNLDFLTGLPIRELVILDRRLTDLEPVYSLAPTLEVLHLTTSPTLHIDVSRFGNLVGLGADWAQVSSSIAGATRLSRVYFGHYGHSDLSPLAPLRALSDITLKDRPKLQSLTGLSKLPEIRRLGVYLAKDLDDVTDLQGRSGIEELELECCRKLSRLDDLAGCVGLRKLNLSECGDLASVRPLHPLTQLELLYLYGSTKIVDGDLTPIAELPRLTELRMQSRRHYRPAVADIQATLPSA